MIRSMTGFGRAEISNENISLRLELKAVNHRYGEVNVRMPRQLSSVEDKIRSSVLKKLSRGRIEIYINLEETGDRQRIVKVDKELALAYHNSLKDLANMLNLDYKSNLEQLTAYPEVLSVKEQELNVEQAELLIEEALAEALKQVEKMRILEGQKLAEDLMNRIKLIEELLGKVEAKAPEVVKNYREKLSKRLSELVDQTVDENRLALEIAIFADKASIDEEVVRLYSHIAQFKESLGENVPIGRKLDFLIQEMNREVNTIGSKANDLDISHVVVDLKSELEKVREQIQNIE
ncbi:uncharacterized protein (TIGR00255 family) [Desulfitispora alkaliphila]|uniref:YicC/YloC family endoribonuclease n=1 Tax=Desulfitispora alkaliphila TaxID=622674 RepID=UPI003D2196C6